MSANKRTIPQIRNRLREIADQNGIPEIHDLVDEMYRRAPARRAPVTSQRFTPALAAEIRREAREHPEMSEQELGNRFEVNPGRISDALHHKK